MAVKAISIRLRVAEIIKKNARQGISIRSASSRKFQSAQAENVKKKSLAGDA
jgi:hypothetical protein